MDPKDWPLLGITWMKMLYFDKTAVMGSRSAPYICQRVTTFIRHIMENIGHYVANYVDDFMGLGTGTKIWCSYQTLKNLLRDLRCYGSYAKGHRTHRTVGVPGSLVQFYEHDHLSYR